MKKSFVAMIKTGVAALAVAAFAAGCGGGGGGGSTSGGGDVTPTTKTINLSGTFSSGAGRVAGRSAADVATGTQIVVYNPATKTNYCTGATSDGSGSFSFACTFTYSAATIDMVIEAVPNDAASQAAQKNPANTTNLRYALNDLSISGATTTVPAITVTSQTTLEANALLYSPSATAAEFAKFKEWPKIFADAGLEDTYNAIATNTVYLNEISGKMAAALTAWKSSDYTAIQKRVIIRDYAMASIAEDTYNNAAAKNALTTLKTTLDTTTKASGVTLSEGNIAASDLDKLVKYYNLIRAAFIEAYAGTGVTLSGAAALEGIEGILDIGKQFGIASEGKTSAQFSDAFRTQWATAETQDSYMAAFGPLGMDDAQKNAAIYDVVTGIAALSTPTVERVKEVFVNSGHMATDASAQAAAELYIALYNKANAQQAAGTCPITSSTSETDITSYVKLRNGIDFKTVEFSPATACLSAEDVADMLEAYYEKDLPKFRSFEDNLEAAINARASDVEELEFLYIYNNIYVPMQTAAKKVPMGAGLDAAGVKKELVWLAMNLQGSGRVISSAKK